MSRLLTALALLAAVACGGDQAPEGTPSLPISPIPADLDEFELSSPAFDEGGSVPGQFSCDGADVSPPLDWAGVPEGTVELLLTLLDPDAPDGVFTHWTVYSIEPSAEGSPEGSIPEGSLQGANDFGEAGYGGPCPPPGEMHRYFFTLAALAEPSGLEAGAPPEAVDAALQRATATTTLTAVYPAKPQR